MALASHYAVNLNFQSVPAPHLPGHAAALTPVGQ